MYCGIRVRLLCAVLTPAAAIALMLLIFLANARLERLGEELEDQARLIANEWAPAIEQALVRDDRKTLLNIVQAAIQDRHIEQIRICDRQGQVLAEAKEPPRSSGLFTLANHLLDQLPASVHQQQPAAVLPLHVGSYNADPPHLLAPTNTFGTLEIGMSVAAATHEDLAALVLPGLLALAALFCAGLFALLIAETLRRPIRSLTHQVQQIEHDRPGGMTLTGVRGELGHLEAAMETMAQALRQRQYLLQEQVRRTTSELRQTLRALEVQNAELDVARKRALEASQTKSQFLANVSHEIRTPINGIVGFTELLSYSPLDAEQRDHVDTIKASCANLLAIINDILDFSKIEAGKLKINSTAFDLRDSIEEVAILLAPSAYDKGLELIHLIDVDVPTSLNGDPIRIQQILTNLVHNAIKFTHRGQIVVRAMLEAESEADARLRITISDTGIGLSEEDRSKLFRAFSQAGTSPARGTGLGLIISKKLVEQMGGTIGLESEPQQGSTFWFTLRLQKPHGAQPMAMNKQKPLADQHILLLEGEPVAQLAAQNLLTPWGADLVMADNEAAFLARLDRDGPWDVAILGITHNVLHRELPDALVSRCVEKGVPLLVLASTVDRAELRRFHKNGACAALTKATRRQTILRELCRLVAVPSPPPPFSTHGIETVTAADTGTRAAYPVQILVVDDNEINRKLVRSIVLQRGAWADEACDGLEAVARCRKKNYDIIFMDIHMPELDGEEAARRIRALYPRERRPKIVALTANAMPGERERLLAGGMDECLIKPLTEAQVASFLDPTVETMASDGHVTGAGGLLGMELKQMLRGELPEHRQRIRHAYHSDDMAQLREHVHQLHGAASICRLTSLKRACHDLEKALLKDKHHVIAGGMQRLLTEIAVQLGESHGHPPPPSV